MAEDPSEKEPVGGQDSSGSGCPTEEEIYELLAGRQEQWRGRTLDDHLDACAQCRQLVALLAADSGPSDDNEEPRWPIGQKLGDRFVVGSSLGSGAMGEVFAAHDEVLDQRVALKLLHRHLGNESSARHRLRKELIVARRITHPNVVRVFDLGVAEGCIFFAMELVEGTTLSALMANEQEPLSTSQALEIVREVCAGVGAAHKLGIVHRDIKPSNVMIRGGAGAVVMDFGLALDLTGQSSEQGVAAGTPAYWSPEQSRGEAATPRSDVYSLGVLATKLLKSGGRSMPPALEALFDKCRAHKPGERLASALELRTAIDAALSGGAPKKTRWRALTALAAALIVAAIGWVAVTKGHHEAEERSGPKERAEGAQAVPRAKEVQAIKGDGAREPVTVRLVGLPEGSEVFVDDEPIEGPVFSVPAHVDGLVLVVKAQGYVPFRRSLQPVGSMEVAVELTKASRPRPKRGSRPSGEEKELDFEPSFKVTP